MGVFSCEPSWQVGGTLRRRKPRKETTSGAAMATRNTSTICLFDVDGTLTLPRVVCISNTLFQNGLVTILIYKKRFGLNRPRITHLKPRIHFAGSTLSGVLVFFVLHLRASSGRNGSSRVRSTAVAE